MNRPHVVPWFIPYTFSNSDWNSRRYSKSKVVPRGWYPTDWAGRFLQHGSFGFRVVYFSHASNFEKYPWKGKGELLKRFDMILRFMNRPAVCQTPRNKFLWCIRHQGTVQIRLSPRIWNWIRKYFSVWFRGIHRVYFWKNIRGRNLVLPSLYDKDANVLVKLSCH